MHLYKQEVGPRPEKVGQVYRKMWFLVYSEKNGLYSLFLSTQGIGAVHWCLVELLLLLKLSAPQNYI